MNAEISEPFEPSQHPQHITEQSTLSLLQDLDHDTASQSIVQSTDTQADMDTDLDLDLDLDKAIEYQTGKTTEDIEMHPANASSSTDYVAIQGSK